MTDSSVKVEGGDNLKKILKEAQANSTRSYEVGFFPKAKYGDGTPVAAVALWNEFGTKDIPERPFFKRANIKFKKQAKQLIKRFLDPKSKTMSKKDAGKIAALHAGAVQQEIVTLKTPPNAQGTIKQKGSSNPLVDTGMMKQSVTWDVD